LEQTSPRSAGVRTGAFRELVYWFAKRMIDILAALVLLVILAPVLGAIAVAIAIDSGLPIIYLSQRIGRYGRPITVLKFRTMRDGSHHHLRELLTADEELLLEYRVARKLRLDPRRTRVGSFLRRTSLDELPQLFNVLTGDMSLVGPRPYFAGELSGRPEAEVILLVRPGITGLWQVSGRSERSFDERIRLDVDYVQRRGFLLDLGLIARTFGAVISGRGAY
jgi:lipopolysaccharide/colanic/teichoic acid biosynthesis glycosyltransferase